MDGTSVRWSLPLGSLPRVSQAQRVQQAEGRLVERWRLPKLWTLHLHLYEAELLPWHLPRLFREALGMALVDHIRRRRVELARHFLEHSTMPIKRIAANVGIPDLHLFNKVIRKALGRPPRAVRR